MSHQSFNTDNMDRLINIVQEEEEEEEEEEDFTETYSLGLLPFNAIIFSQLFLCRGGLALS